MLDYRSASPTDIEAICSLWAAAGVGGGYEVDSAEITERLRNDDGFFVVGEQQGELVAVAMGCYDDHRGMLKRVAIDPSIRGHGHGREIVSEVERRFLAAGVSKLRLCVFDENEAGLSFWQELDYIELETIHYFVKDLLNPQEPSHPIC